MNHKILFRGKRIDNGEWVHGTLFEISDAHNPFIMFKNQHGVSEQVSRETVGQYTGLTDKNGKRIFEGDIIKIPDDYDEFGKNAGEKYEVIFGFGGFRLKPKYSRNAKGYWLEDDGIVEVIGNIHDNPALMEVQHG